MVDLIGGFSLFLLFHWLVWFISLFVIGWFIFGWFTCLAGLVCFCFFCLDVLFIWCFWLVGLCGWLTWLDVVLFGVFHWLTCLCACLWLVGCLGWLVVYLGLLVWVLLSFEAGVVRCPPLIGWFPSWLLLAGWFGLFAGLACLVRLLLWFLLVYGGKALVKHVDVLAMPRKVG